MDHQSNGTRHTVTYSYEEGISDGLYVAAWQHPDRYLYGSPAYEQGYRDGYEISHGGGPRSGRKLHSDACGRAGPVVSDALRIGLVDL